MGFVISNLGAPIGQQPTVKTTGIRKGLKMFGTIELKGGSFQYLQSLVYELKPKSLKLLKETKLPRVAYAFEDPEKSEICHKTAIPGCVEQSRR